MMNRRSDYLFAGLGLLLVVVVLSSIDPSRDGSTTGSLERTGRPLDRAVTAIVPHESQRPLREVEELSATVIQTILGDRSLSAREKSLALLGAIPRLPVAQQLEACDHALLRLDDEAYHPAFELLIANDTADDVRERLMADLMNRSEYLHLPYLVRLASLRDHPYREEARMGLVTTIGDDYGTNWHGWSDAVAARLETSLASVPGADLLQ